MNATLALLTFSPEFRLASALVFWVFLVSVILTLGFTIVVFFGGLADLRFLLKAVDEQPADASDDGRAVRPDDQEDPTKSGH